MFAIDQTRQRFAARRSTTIHPIDPEKAPALTYNVTIAHCFLTCADSHLVVKIPPSSPPPIGRRYGHQYGLEKVRSRDGEVRLARARATHER